MNNDKKYQQWEKEYRQYVSDVSTDTGFDMRHLESFDEWVKTEEANN